MGTLARFVAAAACVIAPIQLGAAKPEFIEESHVVFPRAVEGFELVQASYDSKAVHAGVRLQYRAESADVGIELYIYPAGRMAEQKAIARGVQALRDSIPQAVQAGHYGNVHMAREKNVDVQVSAYRVLHGRMLSFDFTREAVRLEARALLFYRFDFYYMLRATSDAFAAAELDDVVVGAARDLIPEIRVRNRGECRPELAIDAQLAGTRGKDVSAEDFNAALNLERLRLAESGCVENFSDRSSWPAKGEAYKKLKFPPGTWSGPGAGP